MILLCLCSNQLWQNDGSYHQPAAFKHLKYTLSDLQPIRIQSDTYSWSILVLSTNQLYMQMPKVVLGLSIPLNDGGDTGHPCLPVWSQGVKITSDSVISCSLWMKFITTSTSKISPSAALAVWTFKPPEREGLFRYMEIVGLFFKQENTSNP